MNWLLLTPIGTATHLLGARCGCSCTNCLPLIHVLCLILPSAIVDGNQIFITRGQFQLRQQQAAEGAAAATAAALADTVRLWST
jgi:hypothetical protein